MKAKSRSESTFSTCARRFFVGGFLLGGAGGADAFKRDASGFLIAPLALRAELLEGWQPRNSVERLLVDTLVQEQTQYEHWLDVLTSRTTLQAAMVERFHRMVMRTSR